MTARAQIEVMLQSQAAESGKTFNCGICGAWSIGPPHGWDMPCPQAVKESEARIEMHDAQRMSALRSGVGVTEMLKSVRKISGMGEDEDDE